MTAPKLSLVTYSYNDADLAAGLLAGVGAWTVRPDEIVVVDDGSEAALDLTRVLPGGVPAGTRVLRLCPNQGITRAKQAGLSAARGEVLLSVDADVRPDPDYAAHCLKLLEDPGIGLAAGEVVHDAGEGLVSRYLRAFGDNHNLGVTGPVAFIPGNAFALRRTVWEEIGGFAGHTDAVCEDHYLCVRLRERGYALHSDASVRARQTRRLGRTTLCRRVWRWCRETLAAQTPGNGRTVPYLFEVLVRPLLDRLERIAALDEPLFIYLELLYLAHAGQDLLARAEARGLSPEGTAFGLRTALETRLASHPRLRSLLRADLLRLGHAPVTGGRAADFEDFFLFWPVLADSGLLAWLDAEGVPLLLAEDAEGAFHFSAYDRMI